jgi:hypothetical protein
MRGGCGKAADRRRRSGGIVRVCIHRLICTTSNADAGTVFSESRSDPHRAIADSGHAKVNRGVRGEKFCGNRDAPNYFARRTVFAAPMLSYLS